MAEGTGGDDGDVSWVVDRGDYTGCKDDFFPEHWRLVERVAGRIERVSPGLAKINNVDTIRARLPQVRLHVDLEVLGADVTLCCEEHLNVLGGGIEYWGQICRRHDC